MMLSCVKPSSQTPVKPTAPPATYNDYFGTKRKEAPSDSKTDEGPPAGGGSRPPKPSAPPLRPPSPSSAAVTLPSKQTGLTSSRPAFRTVEEELAHLRKENAELRNLVKARGDRSVSATISGPPTADMPKETKNVTLRRRVSEKPQKPLSPFELSEKVQERLLAPGFLQKYDWKRNKDTLILDDTTEKGNEVGVVDTRQIEWWTLVQRPESLAERDDFTYSHGNQLLGGPYVLLSENDVVEAVAVFVAQCVLRMPETSELSHVEMISLLDGTFAKLREKGMIRKAWDWGNFLYSAASWGATAYEIYMEPAIAQMLISSLVASASWIGMKVAPLAVML